jgi:ABC-type transport system involved in multi-copper enzyme maturation permease subunit
VFAAVGLAVALPTSFLCFFIGQRLLASTHAATTLSHPDVLRAVLAAAGYVALCGLFAFGLGAILRSTPGGITAAYGLLFLLPQLAKALPSTWYADLVRWLPGGDVINTLTSTKPLQVGEHVFSAWGELAVFGGYTAVVLAAGALLFRSRDA